MGEIGIGAWLMGGAFVAITVAYCAGRLDGHRKGWRWGYRDGWRKRGKYESEGPKLEDYKRLNRKTGFIP